MNYPRTLNPTVSGHYFVRLPGREGWHTGFLIGAETECPVFAGGISGAAIPLASLKDAEFAGPIPLPGGFDFAYDLAAAEAGPAREPGEGPDYEALFREAVGALQASQAVIRLLPSNGFREALQEASRRSAEILSKLKGGAA